MNKEYGGPFYNKKYTWKFTSKYVLHNHVYGVLQPRSLCV